MDAVPGDLQAKYQKIATEYSKIRAQASVLKKAVLEEQTRNAELRDTLKEREQTLRKAEQEMDSLTFRNQQLTKRVTVLQEELDLLQAKSKKGKPKGGAAVPNAEFTNHVLDEELQKKIEENVQLLTMMQDKDVAHEEEMQALRERVERLEHELQQYRKVNNDAELKYKAVIEQLEKEKSALQHAVEVKDRALEQCGIELTSVTEQRAQLQKELGSQLQTASATIARHLPFVDTTNLELNELNIPRHERKHQIYSLHVISQAGLHIGDLIAALLDYHTYSEQRLHHIYSALSPVNRRLSILLKENARFLRALEEGYTNFQEGFEGEGCISLQTIPSLSKLSDQLLIYTSYLGRLLPYHRLSMEEENSLATCPEALRSCNKEVIHHTSRVTTVFVKLSTYVKLLAVQSKRAQQHPLQSQRRFLVEVTEIVRALHEAIKDLYRAFNVKCNLEAEVPTAAERLHTTNLCLVNALLVASASSAKLSTVLFDSRTELCKAAGVTALPTVLSSGAIHPSVVDFKKRASQYMSCLDQEEPPTVPYEEALKEHEEMKSNALSHETLKEQLSSCRQRATKLEQDKEHWRLEFQLLQLRHCKRVKDLEGQIQSLSGSTTPHSDDSSDKVMPMDPITVTNFLGRLEAPCALSAEAEAREQEVKNYLIGRINELVAVSQGAETKSATSAAECLVLQKRLELCLQNKLEAESSLQQSQDTTAKLQEDLQTTTHNYETQLSIMSEHLANMNDKLAVQRDEIDQLKYQLSNKSSRKSKQK